MTIKKGISRTVILVGAWAVKVPSLRWGAQYFVLGMLGNLYERDRWQRTHHPMLAPTVWCAPFGLLAVQRRVPEQINRLLTREEVAALPFIGYDNNGHNAGSLDGRVVLFDYGNVGMYLWVKEA